MATRGDATMRKQLKASERRVAKLEKVLQFVLAETEKILAALDVEHQALLADVAATSGEKEEPVVPKVKKVRKPRDPNKPRLKRKLKATEAPGK